MNINVKMVKVLISVVIMIGAIGWGITTMRSHNYEGTEISFSDGDGSVLLTNPSDSPVAMQMISTGSRSFRVSSESSDISGTSLIERDADDTTQTFEFMLPQGTTEITIATNPDVRLVSTPPTNLQVVVNPMSADSSRTRIILIVVLGCALLFYVSHTYDHLWISAARRQNADDETAAQVAEQENFDRIMKSRSSKTRP